MIEIGSSAPGFRGIRQDGQTIDFSTFRGRPVVLYFYPKAGSAGCTVEAKGFAEHYPDFQRAGVEVIGVSVDSVESQRRFTEECRLPFPLVADHDRSIARSYGVVGFLGMAKRVTFFVDAGGKVVDRIEGMLPGPHVRRAVERLGAPTR